MARKRNGGAKYFRLGAAFWLAIAALFGIAHFFWPNSSNSPSFAVLAVLLAVILGFVLVYLSHPK